MIEEHENELRAEDEDEELYEHFSIKVDTGQQPVRIDKFLMDRVPNISRNKIQNAAKAEAVRVDGNPVKSNYKVKPLEEISLLLPHPKRETELIAEDIPLDIVYEDEELLVINKAAGLVVHPGHNNFSGTLVNALLFHFEKLPSLNEHHRPGLVHRLDKNTSGLMVVAKTEFALSSLAKQFFDRTTDRRYHALCWGDLELDGSIEGNIGRSLKNRKLMDTFPDGEFGKEARTHYKVLERLNYITLVECKLETGRTHQIRCHFKHIGHPLFGDPEYGGDKILKGTTFTKYRQFVENNFKLLPRQALHAKSLDFTKPSTGERLSFDSELPSDFHEVLERWRNYSKNSSQL